MNTGTRRRRSRSTKQDILVAAAALFAERGFAAVSVQDIGDEVGITGGALYRHYRGKDAVLDAVMLDTIDGWNQVAEEANGGIEALVEVSVRLVVDQPGMLATYLQERGRVERTLRRELAGRERQLFRHWADAMRTGRPGLTDRDISVRQQALNGVLSSLARRPATLGPARLRAALIEGLVAVATAPPVAGGPGRGPARARPPWRAPVPRREQIMATAMGLFAERGYHGVSMEDIGRAVGMAGPSLYEHVAGKGDVLLDAYDRAGAFVIAGAADAVAGAASASEALDRLLGSYATVAFRHGDLLVVTSQEGASLEPSERPRLARRRRDLHEQWSAVVRELRPDLTAADARAVVRCAFALVNGLARARREDNPPVGEVVALGRALLVPADAPAPEPAPDAPGADPSVRSTDPVRSTDSEESS
ncbi:MAG: TetR/AcrR family transcriptional regulator [Acidimicrobiales bacterium]